MSEIAALVAEIQAMKKPRRRPKTLHIGEDRARRFIREYLGRLTRPHEDQARAERELLQARKAMIYGGWVTWGGH